MNPGGAQDRCFYVIVAFYLNRQIRLCGQKLFYAQVSWTRMTIRAAVISLVEIFLFLGLCEDVYSLLLFMCLRVSFHRNARKMQPTRGKRPFSILL